MANKIDKMKKEELLKVAKSLKIETNDEMSEAELKALVAEKQSDEDAKKTSEKEEVPEKEEVAETSEKEEAPKKEETSEKEEVAKAEKTTSENIEKIDVPDRPPVVEKDDESVKVKILEDIGTTTIGGQTFSLKSDQVIVLPKGIAWRLINTKGAVEVK